MSVNYAHQIVTLASHHSVLVVIQDSHYKVMFVKHPVIMDTLLNPHLMYAHNVILLVPLALDPIIMTVSHAQMVTIEILLMRLLLVAIQDSI
jgi:hypothetical protein